MLIFDSLSLCTFEVSLHLLGICGRLTKKGVCWVRSKQVLVLVFLNYCCLHKHFCSLCEHTIINPFLDLLQMRKKWYMINFMLLVLPQEFSVWITHCQHLRMSSNTVLCRSVMFFDSPQFVLSSLLNSVQTSQPFNSTSIKGRKSVVAVCIFIAVLTANGHLIYSHG